MSGRVAGEAENRQDMAGEYLSSALTSPLNSRADGEDDGEDRTELGVHGTERSDGKGCMVLESGD